MQQIRFRKREQLDFKATEAFKALRTNILFCGSDIQVIGITSSTPNEGKTSVSMQLAISFAEAGKRVLFIDADIRKSVIQGRYRISGELMGLTHYLTKQKERDEVIYHAGIENMDIIIAGPVSPNPTELLSGHAFGDLIESERSNYDYILIDAPPLGSVID
ncbi:MAG: CpsD/CapB family tyrosine-protein kinase, partial [Hungatella sp.]